MASVGQASWALSLPGSLGALLAPLLASYLARNGRRPRKREGKGTWSTKQHLELCGLCEEKAFFCVPHLAHMLIFLPFLSRELKHRLRCLVHNEEYSTNVSFHVTEGQSLKNEMERINQEELRDVGDLEFEPQGSQDLCLPMRPVLSSCSILSSIMETNKP